MPYDEKFFRTLFIPLLIFYLGGFKFFAPGYSVYFIDYFLRIIIIWMIWYERDLWLKKYNFKWSYLWLYFFAFLIFNVLLHRVIYSFDHANAVNAIFYETSQYLRIKDPILLAFDLTIGLMLVAVTEEYIFRYKLDSYLKKLNFSLCPRYFMTSFLFAFIHWPQGLLSLGNTFLWGVFFFYLFQKSQSLPFLIVLHFITNFIIFGLYSLSS